MLDFRPFTNVRVLDASYWLGRYATRLFADLGADVIRIEPPSGLPDRAMPSGGADGSNFSSHSFDFLNASKRSFVFDFDDSDDRARFTKLARSAQIIFVERGGPLFNELEQLQKIVPGAVITVISPYGLDGPAASVPATDLTLQAAGGIAWLSGRPDDAPLRLPVDQSVMITSVYAAAATAIALLDAEATGRGHVIDVSAQECIAHSLQNAIQVWDLEKQISRRGGEGTRDASEDIFACKDGFVFIASPPTLGVSWRSLVEWMREIEHPSLEEFEKARWLDRRWRTTIEARTLFRLTFEAFTREFTRDELAHAAIARKIVMAPVSCVSDLEHDEQLRYRDFFRSIGTPETSSVSRFPGPPYRLSEDVWDVVPAPTLGQQKLVTGTEQERLTKPANLSRTSS